jgi:RNA polymerase sigma factor FliA
VKARAKREALILEHLPMVRVIAAQIAKRLPRSVQVDDLVSSGTLGLIEAAEKFKPKRGVPFLAYAKHRVRGSILDYLRGTDYISRDHRRAVKRRERDLGERALQFDVKPDETGVIPLTFTFPSGDARENDVADGSSTQDFFDLEVRMELARILICAALPARYARVLREYYFEERTMRQIAERMGVNESRISQIHKAALEKSRLAAHALCGRRQLFQRAHDPRLQATE